MSWLLLATLHCTGSSGYTALVTGLDCRLHGSLQVATRRRHAPEVAIRQPPASGCCRSLFSTKKMPKRFLAKLRSVLRLPWRHSRLRTSPRRATARSAPCRRFRIAARPPIPLGTRLNPLGRPQSPNARLQVQPIQIADPNSQRGAASPRPRAAHCARLQLGRCRRRLARWLPGSSSETSCWSAQVKMEAW